MNEQDPVGSQLKSIHTTLQIILGLLFGIFCQLYLIGSHLKVWWWLQ